ncbi:5'/3'-nucleotidase SurE [Nocardioides immobilis]|nr:5'/3'-nucleotidase SurE [Nocardioides immobilis]
MTPIRSRRLPRGAAAALAATASVLTLTTPVLVGGPSAAQPAPPSTTQSTTRPTTQSAPLSGLRVLLTNDDSAQGRDTTFGTDGKGLYELRRALCAAGADVLTVAPWLQQSGAGARMTTPGFSPVPLTVQAVTPPSAYAGDCTAAPGGAAVFGVCQSAGPCASTTPSAPPADAVNVALSRFAQTYWGAAPDVVLSGVNFGQNVGATINHSGTVGAAVTAHEYGVPAVALSAEVPRELSQIPHVPFADTAAFAVRLLEELIDADALDDDLVLNVNHPFVAAGQTVGDPVVTWRGPRATPASGSPATCRRPEGPTSWCPVPLRLRRGGAPTPRPWLPTTSP